MAVKQVVLSDLGGEELSDETHTRVMVKHPDLGFSVELDVSSEEAGKLVNTTLRLVEFTIYEPNKPPRTALVETKQIDKLFAGVDFDKVVEGARKVETRQTTSQPRKSSPAKASGGGEPKLDYTAMDNISIIHRGRVTEEEAKLVRENRDVANANRARVGQPPVGEDPKDAQRYNL
jgi:hypothetical protein